MKREGFESSHMMEKEVSEKEKKKTEAEHPEPM